MVCDCCGRKKKLFESFAAVQAKDSQLNFCVECNDVAYKVRDDASEMNKDAYYLHLEQWKKRAKKADISTVRDNMKVIAEIEKNDTGWIDKIYAANGWTRK